MHLFFIYEINHVLKIDYILAYQLVMLLTYNSISLQTKNPRAGGV